jgi:antitoxin MazE
MRVAKWGNSLAVRLPKKVVTALDLKEGDEVNLGFEEGTPPTFMVSRADRVEAIKGLRKFRGRMPKDFKFDRDEANSRG